MESLVTDPCFAPKDYVRVRPGAVTYTNGVATEGAPVRTASLGVFVPTPGKVMQTLPEGRRSSRSLTLYTHLTLKTPDTAMGANADRVEYGGRVWEVARVSDWSGAYEAVLLEAQP